MVQESAFLCLTDPSDHREKRISVTQKVQGVNGHPCCVKRDNDGSPRQQRGQEQKVTATGMYRSRRPSCLERGRTHKPRRESGWGWGLMRRLQQACATGSPGSLNSRGKKNSVSYEWAGSGRGRDRMRNTEVAMGEERESQGVTANSFCDLGCWRWVQHLAGHQQVTQCASLHKDKLA